MQTTAISVRLQNRAKK